MWWQLIPMIIGAVSGVAKGIRNHKKEAEHDKFRKAAIKYSPWTEMDDPGALNLPGIAEAGLSGIGQGALIGGMFNHG